MLMKKFLVGLLFVFWLAAPVGSQAQVAAAAYHHHTIIITGPN
jgi:hypothetical protein